MKYILATIIIIHGLIHLMGFSKAFAYADMTQITRDVSKQSGLLWLMATLLFIIVAVGFLLNKPWWPVVGILAVILSQVLIGMYWQDAKFGTIGNIIILLASISSVAEQRFESGYKDDVRSNLILSPTVSVNVLSEKDIEHLPDPVQKYIRYTGAIGKPKVRNVRIEFEGEMRSKKMDWFKFNTVQYNFFEEPTRLFFMNARMFGLSVPGYHRYQQGTATMDIRVLGLFKVMQAGGDVMAQAETVTVLNDMCLMAPASLIDKRIGWLPIDSLSSKATFSYRGQTVSAILQFNDQGQLIDFVSDDRYEINAMNKYRFSTPVKEYTSIDGRHIMGSGQAVWHYPEGAFVYGKFYLKQIEYNVKELK